MVGLVQLNKLKQERGSAKTLSVRTNFVNDVRIVYKH